MRRRSAIVFLAGLVASAADSQVLNRPSSAPDAFDKWAAGIRTETERDRELRSEAQRKLRSEYELRTSVIHFIIGLSGTLLVTGMLIKIRNSVAIGAAIAGVLVTALSWGWVQLESTTVKLVRCQERAASHSTEIGTQIALSTCTKLYGSP